MKFIYLADTHIGGSDSEGYRKQPRYLTHFQEVIDHLASFIHKERNIDFVMHGGDMVESATPDNIKKAVKLFKRLPCPVYLTPGNHDLTAENSIELWLQAAPHFFPGGKPDFRITKSGIQLDVLTCNWCETPLFWDPDKPQIPWLTDAQWKLLDDFDRECSTRIIITHTPVYGVPPEQYGGTEPLHAPQGDFYKILSKHLERTPLVVGAHTHMNMAVEKNNCRFVTVSAFSEVPFEFKLIEAVPGKVSMETYELGSQVSFKTKYDIQSAYVQGRVIDREF